MFTNSIREQCLHFDAGVRKKVCQVLKSRFMSASGADYCILGFVCGTC